MRKSVKTIMSIALAVAMVCTNTGVLFAEEKPASTTDTNQNDMGSEPGNEDKNLIEKLLDTIAGAEKEIENETEESTEKVTEKSTEESTQKLTEQSTEKATEQSTEKATEKSTEQSTEKTSEKAEISVQADTKEESEKLTDKETEKSGENTAAEGIRKASEKKVQEVSEESAETTGDEVKKISRSNVVNIGEASIDLEKNGIQSISGVTDLFLNDLVNKELIIGADTYMTLDVSNGMIYGTPENPIKREYQTHISIPDDLFTLNVSWNRQANKAMDEYKFVNKVPDTITVPVPIYFEDAEEQKEVTDLQNKFSESGYRYTYTGSIRGKIKLLLNPKQIITGETCSSENDISWTYSAPMSVQYTVDIAAITQGGTPSVVLTGTNGSGTLSPAVAGVNSQYFRNGVDVNAGLDGGESIAYGSNVTVGDSITGYGVRGYGSYGDSYGLSLNPDTENGYSVDTVTVTVYDPLSGELQSTKTYKSSEVDQIPTAIAGKTEIRVSYTKEPDITKTGSDPEYVKKGEEVTYTLTVTNPGSSEKKVIVTDTLPAQVQAVSYTIDGVAQNENWTGSKEVTIPPREGEVDGSVVIVIKTRVITSYQTENMEQNIITNKASMTYDANGEEKTKETEEVKHYLIPVISYTLRKERTTQPEGDGFIAGDGTVIEYRATVKNTGEVPITLKISDAFENSDLFTFVGDTSVENLTLDVNETKAVTFHAKVNAGTAPNLEGYVNTVTSEGTASYQDPKTAETVTVTKETDPEMEKTATAKTPVIATIWVANTTENDQGGQVEVDGFEDTKSNVSSDGNDDNSKNRKPATTVKGTAYDGWTVNVSNITIGVRGAEPVVIQNINDTTGAFSVLDGEGNEISGTVKFSSDRTSAEIKVDSLTKDIDVGIPFEPEKEPEITKTGSSPEYVKKGDTITYTLTVTNPGYKEKEVAVYDNLPKQVQAGSYKVDGVEQTGNWSGSLTLTVPANQGKKIIEIEATVTASFQSASEKAADNVITNEASMKYKVGTEEREKTTEEVNHYLLPAVSYELTKTRTTEPSGDGFIAGDGTVISYEATVKNTGDTPITLDISDVFNDEGLFTFVGDTVEQIIIGVGETKSVTFKATVNPGTAPNLEGYINTVTSEGTATYTDPKTDQEVTITKDDPGMTKTAVAKTPVIATIWVANTTDDNAGGQVEVKGFADTKSPVSSDGEDNNSANRKPSKSVVGTANEKWVVDVSGITVGIRDGEKINIQGIEPGTGTFTVTDAAGNVIAGSVEVSDDQKSVEVSVDNLEKDIDVGISFIPTIKVADVYEGQDKQRGGVVQVVDSGEEPTRTETSRYPTNVVRGTPEKDWIPLVDEIKVNGVTVKEGTLNADGTYTVTDKENQTLTVKITEEADGSVSVEVPNMKVPVDVDINFAPTVYVANITQTQASSNGGDVWVEDYTEPDPNNSGSRYPTNVVKGQPFNNNWVVKTDEIKVNGVVIKPDSNGQFQVTDQNGYVIEGTLKMVGREAVVTILNMDTLVDVDIPFAPTVWVENSTKDENDAFTNEGGKVNVQNNPQNSASSDGNHVSDDGRLPEQIVTGTPDKGWKVDKDAITVNGVHVLKDGSQNADGTYTITDGNGFTITVSLKDGEDGAVSVEIMNMDVPVDVSIPFTRILTTLKIHKTVVNGNQEESFTFTVTLGDEKTPYTGSYTINNEVKQYTAPFTVTLKDGETAEIKCIWAGTAYLVEEAENADYVSASVNAAGTLENENEDYVAEFTNTRKEAGLNISKTVVGGNSKDEFEFKVMIDGKAYSGPYTVNKEELQTTDGSIILKGGQTAIIKGLSSDVSYKVTETNTGSYKLTDSSNTSGTLKAGEETVVKFVNTKKDPTPAEVQVRATKTYTNGTLTSGLFTFRLSGEGITRDAKNDANGNVVFDTLTFTKTGTYQYTLSEVKGSMTDVTYDTSAYTVTVKVTLDEDSNKLKAAVTYTKGSQSVSSATFTNVKKASATTTTKTNSVKTGDSTQIVGFMVLMIAAGIALICLYGRRRKYMN